MNKFVIILLLCIFIFSTLLICIFQPKTHKHIMFENKNFKLELLTQQTEASKMEITLPDINVPVPVLPKVNIAVPQISSVSVDKPSVHIKTNFKSAETKQENVNKKEVEKTDVMPVEKQKTPKMPENNSNLAQKVQNNDNSNDFKKEPIVSASRQLESEPQKEVINVPQEVLTEQELEIIAWNKWRSDLQNKLMKDSKISAPLGTTFFFSFTVDKFGNISNLKTWSDNPSYTQLAVRILKPLLLSYQHTEILTFPQNSKRIITNADGSFTMASSSKYSSPSDYNDYERIVK